MDRFKYILIGILLSIATSALALFVGGELKSALLEKLATDPTGTEARIYYNTTSNKSRIYDGTSWSDIGVASNVATTTVDGIVKAEKTYFHGTDFTLTTSGVGGTVSFVRGVAIPYQTVDGTWWVRGQIAFTHGADLAGNVNFDGVTFKNVSGYNQAFTVSDDGGTGGRGYASSNSDNLNFQYANTSAVTRMAFDLELESKPTWAD